MGDSAKSQLIRKEKANVITNVKKEEINNNINKFLLDFNIKGKAEILKEKLKRYVIRIVKDVYQKRDVKGIFKNEKDQFYSELYAYLTDEVKLAMDEYVQLKRDELHDDIVQSYDQSRKEVMMYAARMTKEPEEKRLLRLSKEYEIMEDFEKSILYYKSRLTIVSNKDSWLGYVDLFKKIGNLMEVEEGVNNCISFDLDDLNLKILYVCVKYLRKRLNDAIYFMNAIINTPNIGLKNTSCNFNLILAFFYKEKGEDLLFKKHLEVAKRFRLKELNLVFPSGTKSIY